MGGGGYIAVVVLDVGAPKYFMLIGIRNYICRYALKIYIYMIIQTNIAIVLNKGHNYNKAVLTGKRHAPC